jgi:hypothetical protein
MDPTSNKPKMQLADFPRWLRGLFALFLILFFFNALYALAFLTGFLATWSGRIDQGLATLAGAIIGLGIVAWQARLGFANLIRSQEHRAAIETEARHHQHQLDLDREQRRIEEEKRILMAALRAEIVGLMHQARTTMTYSIIMHALLEEMIAANAPNSTKSFMWPTFNAPTYQANISKIGLLGASLGADVVRVMTATGTTVPPATFDPPVSNQMIAKLYHGLVDGMREWHADLHHVAMRIRAFEENTPDPGTLLEAQNKRQEAAKKSASSFEG